MRMRGKATHRRDDILVDHPQRMKVLVIRIMIIGEGKAEAEGPFEGVALLVFLSIERSTTFN